MFKNFKIVTRITSLILIGAGLLIALLSGYDYYNARSIIEHELQERARNLARATANEMEIINRAVEKIAHELAITLKESPLEQTNLNAVLMETMVHHHEIDGVGILLDQYGDDESFLYAYRQEDGIKLEDIIETADYNYRADDWYQFAVHLGESWSEPYYGSVSRSIRVTYAVPLENNQHRRIGVVIATVDLHKLTKKIQQLKVGERGKAFVTSRNGTFIAYPDLDFIMRESFFSLARELNRPELHKIGQRMQAGESDFVHMNGLREDREYWLAFTDIADSGWSMGVLFDKAELYAELIKLIRDKIIYGVVCAILLLLIAWWIARSISQPIQRLESAAIRISTGDLETEIPQVEGKNEIANLCQSFGNMQRDLKGHIKALEKATAERARIESDLQIAREIQNGLLPTNFGDVDKRCELYAFLEPAKEVGGDFYDFAQLDENHVFFAIGDATGKGVPAALFAALTRTMLRIHIQNHSPAKAIERVNNDLAADNDTNMFITLFVGVLDLRTGELQYANGGHNPPVHLSMSCDKVEFLPKTEGIVVGPMPGMSFEGGFFNMRKGDHLLLYTDGIVEAEDGKGFYGEDRMMHSFKKSGEQHTKQIVETLLADVIQFRGTFDQSDDITILSIKF